VQVYRLGEGWLPIKENGLLRYRGILLICEVSITDVIKESTSVSSEGDEVMGHIQPEPGVQKSFKGVYAVVRVFLKHLLDEVFGFKGELPPVLGWIRHLAFRVLGKDLFVIPPGENKFAR
jgi:hypothetical protein